ncbi:MAG: polysaccharide deacetylase family protein [Acidobacteriota bacterium]|nr:polysaccharide deacetylase family protein [Acidobacteriota bacterium]
MSGEPPTWREIEKWRLKDRVSRARNLARATAIATLFGADSLTGRVDRALARPRVHLLYLHHVLADEEQPFRDLLTRLQRQHTFISHSEGLERIRQGQIERPYVAFSVDDGLRNGLRVAAILEEFGASACFFVCTSMMDERRPERIRDFCAEELSLPPMDFLTWDDCEELLRRGHEIGNHSSHHKTLRGLPVSQLEEYVGGALMSLRARLGDIRHFAWPRGRFDYMSAEAAAMVHRAGHQSCSSAERGAHVVAGEGPELCLRRDHVIAGWPLEHVLWFMARSSRRASTLDNAWPEGWFT